MRRAALLAVLALGCATPHPVTPGQTLELSLPKLDGGSLALDSLRGKVLLVDVWASWCRPCAQALPFYDDLQKALGPRGFQFVGVNVDEDERAARAFLREENLTGLLTVRDPGAEVVGSQFGIGRLPTAFLVDRNGRVRQVHEGFTSASAGELRGLVEGLLAEAPAVNRAP